MLKCIYISTEREKKYYCGARKLMGGREEIFLPAIESKLSLKKTNDAFEYSFCC